MVGEGEVPVLGFSKGPWLGAICSSYVRLVREQSFCLTGPLFLPFKVV